MRLADSRLKYAGSVLAITFVLSACSRSPTDVAISAANSIGQKVMGNLAPKDASAQAERMISLVGADQARVRDFQDSNASNAELLHPLRRESI